MYGQNNKNIRNKMTLLELNKSSKKPKEGDVFYLEPIKGRYYLGRVVNDGLFKYDDWIFNGVLLLYIYDTPLDTPSPNLQWDLTLNRSNEI